MAHAVATAGLADAFADHGCPTILITAGTGGRSATDLKDQYGLRNAIRWLPVSGFSQHNEWFAALAAPQIAALRPRLVHTRDLLLGVACARMGFATVVEAHPLYTDANFRVPSVLRELADASCLPAFAGLLVLGRRAADHYAAHGVDRSKIRIEPCGIDRTLFTPPDADGRAAGPKPRPTAIYCGHLYDWKGIPTVLAAAEILPDVDFRLVGGHDDDISRIRRSVAARRLANVEVVGALPHGDIPELLRNADVALVPATRDHWTAETSAPLKLGEAFAVGTPVVASDIPALADIGARDAVYPVAPDDPAALAEGISNVLNAPEIAQSLRARGSVLAERWDVNERAGRLLSLAADISAPSADGVYATLCGGWYGSHREG